MYKYDVKIKISTLSTFMDFLNFLWISITSVITLKLLFLSYKSLHRTKT